jgi:hypothetical protein
MNEAWKSAYEEFFISELQTVGPKLASTCFSFSRDLS